MVGGAPADEGLRPDSYGCRIAAGDQRQCVIKPLGARSQAPDPL